MGSNVTVDISGQIIESEIFMSDYFLTVAEDQTVYGNKNFNNLVATSFIVNPQSLQVQGKNQGQLSLTGTNNLYNLSITPGGSLNLNVSRLLLSGVQAPLPPNNGQNLLSQGHDGLQWFNVNNIESGIYVNTNEYTGVNIPFNTTYSSPPSVIVTADSGGNNEVIPVTLNGVSTSNFSVIFSSNKLTKFSYVVLPLNASFVFPTNEPGQSSPVIQNISTSTSLTLSHLEAGKVTYDNGIYSGVIRFSNMFPTGYIPSVTLTTFGGSFAALSVYDYTYNRTNNCTGFIWVSNGDVGTISYMAI